MSLDEIKNCCTLIESDKITDRKKGSEKLRYLLGNEEIVKQIQKSKRKSVNWASIFNSAKILWLKESEKLEKEERKKETTASAAVKSGWLIQKQNSITLPKIVIRKSFSAPVPSLPIDVLISFILLMMDKNRPYLVENYSSHAVEVIRNYILDSTEYCKTISVACWKDIIKQCIWIYENKVANVNGETVFGVLEGILQVYEYCKGSQTECASAVLGGVPSFLSRILQEINPTMQQGAQNALLQLLVTLCEKFGTHWRETLCKIGDKSMILLLKRWENHATEKQGLLMKFANLLMLMHQDNSGVLSASENEDHMWEQVLNKLFKLVKGEIEVVSRNFRLAGDQRSKDSLFLSQEFNSLAARLCVHVFQNGGTVQNNNATLWNCSYVSTNGARRLKVESTFDSLVEFLRTEGANVENLPWLVIVRTMVDEQWNYLSSDHLDALLQLLVHLMQLSKDSVLSEEIIRCVERLSMHMVESKHCDHEFYKSQWSSLFDRSLRLVSGGQCIDIGLHFMSHLIECHKKDPDSLLFNYFMRGVFPGRPSSFHLLSILLRCKSLPLRLQIENMPPLLENENPRIQLLHQLLPIDGGNETIANVLRDPNCLSEVFHLLKLHDPLRSQNLGNVEGLDGSVQSSNMDLTPRVLLDMQNNVIDRLVEFVSQVDLHNNSSKDTFDIITHAFELVILMDVDDARLFTIFKMHSWCEKYMKELINSKDEFKWVTLETCLANLENTYKIAVTSLQKRADTADRFRRLFDSIPRTLFTTLKSIAVTSLQAASSTQSRHDERLDIDDDFDAPLNYDNQPSTSNANIFEDETTKPCTSIVTVKDIKLTAQDSCSLSAANVILHLGEVFSLTSLNCNTEQSTCLDIFAHFIELSQTLTNIHQTALIFRFLFTCAKCCYQHDNIDDCFMMISHISNKYADDARIAKLSVNVCRDILKNNGEKLSSDQKLCLLQLTNSYRNRTAKQMYGQDMTYALFEVDIELVKLDPSYMWGHGDDVDKNCAGVYAMLKNPFHDARSTVGSLLVLLMKTPTQYLSPTIQSQRFLNIYQSLIESLNFEAPRMCDLSNDERNSRISTVVSALVSIAVCSPYLEPKSLYSLCSLRKIIFTIDLGIIKEAIKRISKEKNCPYATYIDRHLSSMVCQWIQDKYQLSEFPYELLQVESFAAFCNSKWRTISLAALNEDKPDVMLILSQHISVDCRDLLQRNFAPHVASVVPYILHSSQESFELPITKINSGIKHYKLIKNEIGDHKMIELIKSQLGEVVLSLLNLGYDPTSWFEGDLVFPQSRLNFSPDVIQKSIEKMHTVFFEKEESVLSLLAEQRWPLHTVMDGLLTNLATSTITHEYRWALVKIQIFTLTFVPHINRNAMDFYVIQKLITMLTCYLDQLATISQMLTVKCLEILWHLVGHILKTCPDVIIPHINVIYYSLLQFASQPVIWKLGVSILDNILKCRSPSVKTELSKLPLLPENSGVLHMKELHELHYNVVQNARANWSLSKVVEAYLEIQPNEISVHALDNIATMLNDNNNNLSDLNEECNENGHSLMHRFIHHLIVCMTNSSSDIVKRACLNCLGLIGPVNLETDIFSIHNQTNNQNDIGHTFYINVILCVKKMTLLPDINIVKGADLALRKVFATKTGVELRKAFSENLVRQLLPYLHAEPLSKKRKRDDATISFEDTVCDDNNWCSKVPYTKWIRNLTVSFLKCDLGSEFLTSFIDLCEISESLCAKILPHIVYLSLTINTVQRRTHLSKVISKFIDAELSSTPDKRKNNDRHLVMVLEILNYLRLQHPKVSFTQSKKITKWDNNFWLDLDYSQVAEAASLCDAPFSSLLFAEIACEQIKQSLPYEENEKLRQQNRQLQPLQRITCQTKGMAISSLLLKTYNSIGDSHGVEACSGTLLSNSWLAQGMQTRYRHNWMSSMAIGDAASDSETMIENLRQTGLFHVLNNYLSSDHQESKNIMEAKAECCWRLASWEEDVSDNNDLKFSKYSQTFSFHQSFVSMLTELKNRDLHGVNVAVGDSKNAIYRLFAENSKESTTAIYPLLAKLQIVSEFKRLSQCVNLSEEYLIADKFEETSVCLDKASKTKDVAYDYLELILAARVSTIKAMLSVTKNSALCDLLFETLIKKCELARLMPTSECKIRQYQSSILECRKLELSNHQLWRTQLEEAQFSRAIGNKRDAERILVQLLEVMNSQQSNPDVSIVESKVLSLCGQIFMESRTKSPKAIVNDYLLRSISILEENSVIANEACKKDVHSSFYTLGSYGDLLYQEVLSYMTSDQWKSRKMQIENSKKELNKVIPLLSATSKDAPEYISLRRSESLLKKDIVRESSILKQRQEEAAFYLCLALENYLKCLSSTDDTKMIIFRLVALWLENLRNEQVNQLMHKFTEKIKSYQFLPLLYQLVARLTKRASTNHHQLFPQILIGLLERICKEHPHHGLPIVLMLANSHLDEDFSVKNMLPSGRKPKRMKTVEEPVEFEDRVESAKLLITRLKQSNIADHLTELEKVCVAYVQLANAQIGNTTNTDALRRMDTELLRFLGSSIKNAFTPN